MSTPTHERVEFDVDSPNAYARGCHLNNRLLSTGEPVLVRFFEPAVLEGGLPDVGVVLEEVAGLLERIGAYRDDRTGGALALA